MNSWMKAFGSLPVVPTKEQVSGDRLSRIFRGRSAGHFGVIDSVQGVAKRLRRLNSCILDIPHEPAELLAARDDQEL